jgi:hypothetical protein
MDRSKQVMLESTCTQDSYCLHYKRDVLFLVYMDDGILVSPHNGHLHKELKILQKQFNISVEGTLINYVGVNIERRVTMLYAPCAAALYLP